MRIVSSLLRPKAEYVFRPSQIVHRIIRELRPTPIGYKIVVLPWGLPLRIRPQESFGSWVWRLGVGELTVSESLHRLVDCGELAIDVGAHIGHMTSIMSVRAGKSGRVWSFEPHPLTFEELVKNVQRWKGHGELAEVFAHQVALSDRNGEGLLNIPGEDSTNRAVASVHNGTHSAGAKFTVALGRLEELVTERDEVGVLKIDVEGHEYQALRGAESLLQRHRIRDILFEDYQPYPSLTSAMLERYGYSVFTVRPRLLGLSLGHGFRHPVVSHGYIPTYLATIDPDRVIRRLNPRGWIALRRYSRRCQE